MLFCDALNRKNTLTRLHRKERHIMNADLKGRLRFAKYPALAIAVAVGLGMPAKITARTAVRGASIERQANSETQKTAAKAFKNIQVLKDIPAD
jgi:hypothetical protein